MHDKLNSEYLKTILIFEVVLILGFLKYNNLIYLYLAIILGIICIISKSISIIIHKVWLSFGYILELIIPKFILFIVFYFVLYPTALISRIFVKNDTLKLKNINSTTFEQKLVEFNENSFIETW